MAEIGSEFWSVPTSETANHLFPEDAQWYLSGRSALTAILLELKNCHTAALPSWCCDSVISPFLNAGMEVKFYPVYFDKEFVQELRFDCDILFVMDFFGFTGSESDLSGFRGTVIRDATHSLFSKDYSDADYCFGSLRKWCGVWTGGYAWAKDGHRLPADDNNAEEYLFYRRKGMELKTQYVCSADSGNYDRAVKEHLRYFAEAEQLLDSSLAASIAPADERDVFLAAHLDREFIVRCRRTNARILMDAFPDLLVFPELGENDCPMFVPILVPDGRRNALRQHLIDREIYCPVHWPVSGYHKLGEREAFLYNSGLSLVCDQRYGPEDMHRVVRTVKAFL